jgi:predicted DNA-binding protein
VTVQNRISISFNDKEFEILERLSTHTQKPKAELVRLIVEEYLRKNPERFRLRTSKIVKRSKNIVISE